jgi:hypothetical protein
VPYGIVASQIAKAAKRAGQALDRAWDALHDAWDSMTFGAMNEDVGPPIVYHMDGDNVYHIAQITSALLPNTPAPILRPPPPATGSSRPSPPLVPDAQGNVKPGLLPRGPADPVTGAHTHQSSAPPPIYLCVELLDHLRLHLQLRARTPALLDTTRSRAIRWLTERKFSERAAATLMPPTVAYAFRASREERASWLLLDHKDTVAAVRVNRAIKAGEKFGAVHRPGHYDAWPWEWAWWRPDEYAPGAALDKG